MAQRRAPPVCVIMGGMNGITGKPLLFDKLHASLPAKISKWIAEDTERAQERKRRRRLKKRAEDAAADNAG